ncbi:hypothetical protein Y032_0108g54 [Ancylostoma ceylanicum]|uniref:Uncharacterized protein n=1 Tax=Ancylostoma ceylanicum TaxID=53326 RepID=A0A016TF65_9BILA|nr:hypothetical protein Y032_0108g54 [Ancylostoma ceylanicum]
MNNTVLNYWKFTQRSVRTIIVGSTVGLTKWSQEDWRVLDGPQNLGLILRSSRSTRIPCISFNKVRLLKSTLERLSKSVEESGVVINQCEFNNCQFQCGVYDLVTFLEISKVQRVAIIGSVTGRPIFMKYLLGSAYVKTISLAIIIGSNCSTLPLFPHAVFMPENLKIVLNRTYCRRCIIFFSLTCYSRDHHDPNACSSRNCLATATQPSRTAGA